MTMQQYAHTARSPKNERLEARVTRQQKDLLQRAAELRGLSLTDFLVVSAERAAVDTIRDYNMITLTARDSLIFADALLNPQEPNENLRAALAEYMEDTISID